MPTEKDYINAVIDIAQGAPKRNSLAYIHESVDWCEFIVYYSNNEIVMNATNNEPDDDELPHVIDGAPTTWRTLRNEAARLAMYADVQDEIARLQS